VAWAVVIVIDHCRSLCHSLSSSLATPRPSPTLSPPLSSDYSGSDGDYFYKMNVCGPANAGGPCGNALVCQYNAKTTNFVAKIAVYDGYFGPRLTLLDGNNPGAGVQAHYLNGDICFLGPTKKRNPRTTIVGFRSTAATQRNAVPCDAGCERQAQEVHL